MVKTYFYYLRDKDRKPLVTVCLHCVDDKYYRGVATCSTKDNPVKRIGRNIAFGRALQAVKHGEDKDGICRSEAVNVHIRVDSYLMNKFTDKPFLELIEQKLIKKAGE